MTLGELNLLVAEHVMGFDMRTNGINAEARAFGEFYAKDTGKRVFCLLNHRPVYVDRDIWDVVEAMREKACLLEFCAASKGAGAPWGARFTKTPRNPETEVCPECGEEEVSWKDMVHAPTPGETICLAALRALGVMQGATDAQIPQ